MAEENRLGTAIQQTIRRYTDSNFTLDKWLDHCPVLGVVVTPLVIHFVGPKWREVLGWRHRSLHLPEWKDWVHPDDQELVHHALAAVIQGDESEGFLARYRTVSGAYRHIYWSGNRIETDQGPVVYGAGFDLTDEAVFQPLVHAHSEGV